MMSTQNESTQHSLNQVLKEKFNLDFNSTEKQQPEKEADFKRITELSLKDWLTGFFKQLKMFRNIEISTEQASAFKTELEKCGYLPENRIFAGIWMKTGDWRYKKGNFEFADFFPKQKDLESCSLDSVREAVGFSVSEIYRILKKSFDLKLDAMRDVVESELKNKHYAASEKALNFDIIELYLALTAKTASLQDIRLVADEKINENVRLQTKIDFLNSKIEKLEENNKKLLENLNEIKGFQAIRATSPVIDVENI